MTTARTALRRPAAPALEQPSPTRRLEVVAEESPETPWDDSVAHPHRTRLVTLAALVLTGFCLFGLAGFHVVITQNQFRLERLAARAADEQARYERLRLRVAELESPERIVASAQQRLGMVPPPGVTYVSPARSTRGRAAKGAQEAQGTGRGPAPNEAGSGQAARGHAAGDEARGQEAPGGSRDQVATGRHTGAAGWSTVKPHLAEEP